MAGKTWREALPRHSIFTDRRFEDDIHNCLAEQDGDFFLWDNLKKELGYVNLKLLNSFAKGYRTEECLTNAQRYQVLLCSNAPHFVVERLIISPTGQYLAMMGANAVMVVEVPQSRVQGFFGDGRKVIQCRSFYVDERFLTVHSNARVCQLKWHPASISDTHFFLLTSDNVIRLYNVLDPCQSQATIPVVKRGAGMSRTISMANAEGAVDFDLLPYHALAEDDEGNDDCYAIFVLMETGDVWCVYHSFNETRAEELIGPLRMQPPAEDNYGVDSCSLLCLNSRPPLLVVATSSGKLYHCVTMMADDRDDSTDSFVPYLDFEKKILPQPMLYVLEGVDLELLEWDIPDASASGDFSDTEQKDTSLFACLHPVQLHSAGESTDFYYCSHKLGVHSVVLPLVQEMELYCTEGRASWRTTPFDLDIERACIVQHLMSTRPIHGGPRCALVSVCTVHEHRLDVAAICLTSNGDCLTLFLRPSTNMQREQSALAGGDEDSSAKVDTSPFEYEVRQLLSKRGATPVLRWNSSGVELSQQDIFHMLASAITEFRQHFQVMKKVSAIITGRSTNLLKQMDLQRQNVVKLRSGYEEFDPRVRRLTAKMREARERHAEATRRLVALNHKLEMRVPVRSDAEIMLDKELATMDMESRKLSQLVEQAETKVKFFRGEEAEGKKPPASSVQLNEEKTQQLRRILKRDLEDITKLISQVKELQIDMTV